MRVFFLLLLSSFFLGFNSCAEDVEEQLAQAPLSSPESNLIFAFEEVPQICSFGCKTGVNVSQSSMGNVHYKQTFFLTVDDVTEGGVAKGTSDMIQISFLRRASASPIENLRMDFDRNNPGTTIIQNGEHNNSELILVSGNGGNNMDFTTGDHTNPFRIEDGVLIYKTNPTTGLQSMYLDVTTDDGREITGKWSGKFEEVEVPFL